MVLDAEAEEKLGGVVAELMNDSDKRKSLGENALAMALRDSDEKIIDCIYDIVRK